MSMSSWTARVGLGFAGLLAAVVLFLIVVRVGNIEIAGVAPEAWIMTFMMTGPFTLGFVAFVLLVSWGLEKVFHRREAEPV